MTHQEISWQDYSVYMGGRKVTGIRGFDYGIERVKESIYAEGCDPVGTGYGNKTYKCQITVLISELNAIIASSKTSDPNDIAPFTVVHQYKRAGSPVIITDVIENAEFMGFNKTMAQGATFAEVTLPMVCTKIRCGVPAALLKKYIF